MAVAEKANLPDCVAEACSAMGTMHNTMVCHCDSVLAGVGGSI